MAHIRVINIYCSLVKLYFSMWMSKSGLFYSMEHVIGFRWNGGPDRTRTYDPRLIKAVL
jgi:hypothetical protein